MKSSLSRTLSTSSMLSLSSTEWSGDETGLNTAFFETSDSDSVKIKTSDSDTDSLEPPKKKARKKSPPKQTAFSSSESDSSSDEDILGQLKNKTSTPMKKHSVDESKVKKGLQNFSRDFPVENAEPSAKDPTSSKNGNSPAKKMKIEETVKTEPRSSSESQMKKIKKLRKKMFQKNRKLKVLEESSDHLQDRVRRRDDEIKRRDEKIKELSEKNLDLIGKLEKKSKTPNAQMCTICFDSVSITIFGY